VVAARDFGGARRLVGGTADGERGRAVEAGADDILETPFSLRALLARLDAPGARARRWAPPDSGRPRAQECSTGYRHLTAAALPPTSGVSARLESPATSDPRRAVVA
jgi:DNA-binding response OmpR family regulator